MKSKFSYLVFCLSINMHKIAAFKEFIWNFYHQNKREFAWRHVDNPYYVVVSELMLSKHRLIV